MAVHAAAAAAAVAGQRVVKGQGWEEVVEEELQQEGVHWRRACVVLLELRRGWCCWGQTVAAGAVL